MLSYAVRRLGQALLTLLGVATFVFFSSRLSGDPVALLVPAEASDAVVAAVRHDLGLDQPLLVQYLTYLAHLLRGDFGLSLRSRDSAIGIVFAHLPATISLALISFALGIGLALLLGVGAQLLRRRWVSDALLWLTLIRESIPVFWFGLLLITVFSVQLHWLPSIGNESWQSYILPSITLATLQLALFIRLFSAGFGRERGQDYVRTARAKGIGYRRTLLRHMLPNVLLPVITVGAINLGVLLTGTVVVEKVFSWPGVGRLIVDAVGERDYPVVQAGILTMAAIFIVVNALADLLYTYVDPRVRLS